MEIKNWSLSQQNKANLYAKIDALDLSENYVANITKRKTSRSIEQNRLLWEFFTQFGNHIGYEGKNEIERFKLMVTLEVAPVFIENKANGEVVALPPETSKMNTSEFTDLMEACFRYASKEYGFIFIGE